MFADLEWAYVPKTLVFRGLRSHDEVKLIQDRLVGTVANKGTVLCFKQAKEVIHKFRVLSENAVVEEESTMEKTETANQAACSPNFKEAHRAPEDGSRVC